MNWFRKAINRFTKYPLGLKIISIIILTSIAVIPFLKDLPLYYEISAFLFCLSIISLCYSLILMKLDYAKAYRCSLKKKNHNNVCSILLLFLSCILLFSSMVFLLIPIKKSLHIDECSPPQTQVGTTCCILSNKTNAFCVDEEDPFFEKFNFAFNNSVITANTTLANEKETFSFHPEDGYYILFDVEMLDRITSFYLIKPIDNENSACEIKIAERELGLTFMSRDKIVEEMMKEANKLSYSGKQEDFVTDNGASGYLLVFTSPSKPMRKLVVFFNKSDIITFISSIGDNKYAEECNKLFDKTAKSFQWEN